MTDQIVYHSSGTACKAYVKLLSTGRVQVSLVKSKGNLESVLGTITLECDDDCISMLIALGEINSKWPGIEQPRSFKVRLDQLYEEGVIDTRTFKRLNRAKILTVGDLISWSPLDLKRINGFGSSCLRQVREMLAKNGLHLRDDERYYYQERG